jgi:hypothetical protein
MWARSGDCLLSLSGIPFWLDEKHSSLRWPRKFYGISRPLCEYDECEESAGDLLYCHRHLPRLEHFDSDSMFRSELARFLHILSATQSTPEGSGLTWKDSDTSNCVCEFLKATILIMDFVSLNCEYVRDLKAPMHVLRAKVLGVALMKSSYAIPDFKDRYAWLWSQDEFPPLVAQLLPLSQSV